MEADISGSIGHPVDHSRLFDSSDEGQQFDTIAEDAATYFQDSELVVGHTWATDLRPGEKFNQKIPPTCDGEMSFSADEKLVCEWCSIATVHPDKRAPLLLNTFTGHAVVHK